MKFTPEVIAALAVLRNAAENDFERHRLDVLERDLTAPPQVEVIDDTHQRFNGIIYKIDKSKHLSQTISIHRDVWQYHNGEIPAGYVIHHIDKNPVNNNISNLKLLTKEEHQKYHRKYTPEKICPNCGKKFIPVRRDRVCCSNDCARKLIAKKVKAALSTLEEKICPQCGKKFKPINSKIKYCSRTCAYKAGWKKNIEVTCLYCGKKFIADRPQRMFCSYSCSSKAKQQFRKNLLTDASTIQTSTNIEKS